MIDQLASLCYLQMCPGDGGNVAKSLWNQEEKSWEPAGPKQPPTDTNSRENVLIHTSRCAVILPSFLANGAKLLVSSQLLPRRSMKGICPACLKRIREMETIMMLAMLDC